MLSNFYISLFDVFEPLSLWTNKKIFFFYFIVVFIFFGIFNFKLNKDIQQSIIEFEKKNILLERDIVNLSSSIEKQKQKKIFIEDLEKKLHLDYKLSVFSNSELKSYFLQQMVKIKSEINFNDFSFYWDDSVDVKNVYRRNQGFLSFKSSFLDSLLFLDRLLFIGLEVAVDSLKITVLSGNSNQIKMDINLHVFSVL